MTVRRLTGSARVLTRSRYLAAVAIASVALIAVGAAADPRLLASGATTDPSGVPPPRGDLPGWRQVFVDDFTGSSLSNAWFQYDGLPGSDHGGWWSPSHDIVSGGELRLTTSPDRAVCTSAVGCRAVNNEVSGGLKMRFGQTYGKYLVRLRAKNAHGVPIVALLWPQTNQWPPEIDFVEDNGASPRVLNTATVHYGSSDTQIARTLRLNFALWHTLGVEWSPGSVRYTIDGRVWATVVNAHVPSIPMALALQAETFACDPLSWEQCPNASTPRRTEFDIDWVAVYARAG